MRYRAVLLAGLILLGGCSPQKIQQPVSGSLEVRSTTLAAGRIPDRCGCAGPGVVPEISWSDPPAGTRSFAILMDDQDAPIGYLHRRYFVHWVAFDLSADRREMPEGPPNPPLHEDERLGTNDVGQPGYSGPCPPSGPPHHYAVTVYALDTRLNLPATTDGGALLTAVDGHILARGQIVGTYSH